LVIFVFQLHHIYLCTVVLLATLMPFKYCISFSYLSHNYGDDVITPLSLGGHIVFQKKANLAHDQIAPVTVYHYCYVNLEADNSQSS